MNPRFVGNWRREVSAPLNALQSELNRLLNQYRNLGPLGPTVAGEPAADATDIEPASWTPALDVVETPEEIVVWADLPGVDPAGVELTVTGRVLTLRGYKHATEHDETRGHVLERPSGPFHRQLALSGEVEVERIEAEAHDGVLRIRLPKAESVRPRSIPIRSTGA